MEIRRIMTKSVATCRPDTNLAAVTKTMWDRDCGFVPIVDDGGTLVGVVTDRDICIASATRRMLPEQITAAEVMHRQPIHTALPDETVERALATMKQFQVRRLPVVSADGKVAGVISMNDIVLASRKKDGPASSDIVGTLAAICAHPAARPAAAA